MDTINYLPHVQEQMESRGISAEAVAETIVSPDKSYIGRFGRVVAEKDFGARILRVVYNEGQDEAIVITAVPLKKRGGGR
jgi:Domain of unknown function (DUF4258)